MGTTTSQIEEDKNESGNRRSTERQRFSQTNGAKAPVSKSSSNEKNLGSRGWDTADENKDVSPTSRQNTSLKNSKGHVSNSKYNGSKAVAMDPDYGRMKNVGLLVDMPRANGSKPFERAPSSIVNDSNVTVNLAMADLMAYLQVVANNSSNLPFTRRDDPELGKTVSSLTTDEYAKKCSAFIPSDVRIISGSFTKYGRVWELPTSEEFMPSDSTQEPGLSHGGACGNALLKVLYDMESEINDEMAQVDYTNTANLFDDDDDEEEMRTTNNCRDEIELGENNSFESTVLNAVGTQSSMSWAELLRKMREEIHLIGHCQAPFVTSSRKFDLNQPFSIVPSDFDYTKNKKRSLLIGCNYSNMPEAQLKASHDDIRSMKDFIVNVHGFPETRGLMTVLIDDDDHKHPTHLYMTEAFKALSEESQPGDAVFVYFSGHGCRVLDSPIDAEVESYDEALLPSDYLVSGMIRDTLIFKTLLAPMRNGVTVTILIDCCDTGMVLDLPYAWSTKNDRADVSPKMSLNDDFSFVRFLKVIKTLYESSTFTQLGQTVRSAINGKHSTPLMNNLDDDENSQTDESTLGGGSLITMDENETIEERPDHSKNNKLGGFMDVFNVCQYPQTDPADSKLRHTFTDNTFDEGTRDALPSTEPSLFQQVLNCTLLNNPALSDEDSYHRHDHEVYDTYDETDDDYYDSFTEDEGGRIPQNYARRRDLPRNRRR